MNTRLLPFIACAVASLGISSTAFAQGTAFTYQGRLNDGTAPASGIYDLRFAIFDTATAGAQQGGTVATNAIAVNNGLFTVTLDFGNQFPGAARWLEIGVRTNGAGGFTTLAPRQTLAATPYAITAGGISGTLPTTSLAGTYGGVVTFNNAGNSFSGGGGNLTGLNASQLTSGTVPTAALGNVWKTTGNAGADPNNGAFLGTTDNLPLEFKVNGLRALRIEPTANGRPNVIGGSAGNNVAPGVQAATIAGGSLNNIRADASYSIIAGGESNEIGTNSIYSSLGGGQFNTIAGVSAYGTIAGGNNNGIGVNSYAANIGGGSGNYIAADSGYSCIVGGFANGIGSFSFRSAIGGGYHNGIDANSSYANIAGGFGNKIGTNADHSAIGGGGGNIIESRGQSASIAGGENNVIGEDSDSSAIGGGDSNNIADNSRYATIAGGESNAIGRNSDRSAIGGGHENNIAANSVASAIGGGFANSIPVNAIFATIPGGYLNFATNSAFAAGTYAKATHSGAFVWADSRLEDFASTASDQFNIRARGGVRLNTDTSISFGNQTRQMLNLYSNIYGIGVQSGTLYFRCENTLPNNGFIWYRGGVHADGYLQAGAGGTEMMHLVNDGLYVNGTFVSSSDRNMKENFKPVDARAVLDKVAALPLTEWNYKANTSARHLGPMAQDFYAAFGVGPDDKHITTVDEGGVALAAIQGLNQKHEAEVKSKDVRIRELETRLERLESMMAAKGGSR